jgi:hypothetical protein
MFMVETLGEPGREAFRGSGPGTRLTLTIRPVGASYLDENQEVISFEDTPGSFGSGQGNPAFPALRVS